MSVSGRVETGVSWTYGELVAVDGECASAISLCEVATCISQ